MSSAAHRLFLGLAITLASTVQLHADELWKGTVKQNSGASDYTVVMRLSGSGGATDYPELKCSGALTRVGQSGSYSFYLEKVTTAGSSCIDGAITLVRSDGAIAWGWVGAYKGKTLVGWSILAPQ